MNYQKCSLPRLASIWVMLSLARAFLWLARASDRYSGIHMRIARRAVEALEAACGIAKPEAPLR